MLSDPRRFFPPPFRSSAHTVETAFFLRTTSTDTEKIAFGPIPSPELLYAGRKEGPARPISGASALTAADSEHRNSEFVPSAATRRAEPQFSWTAQDGSPVKPAQPPAAASHFESDAPAAPNKAAFAPQTLALLQRLADLLRRSDAPTPFAAGLFAPPGGGKTSALDWLTDKLQDATSPPVASLRASDLAADPERTLAAALYRALSPRHGALAQEAAQEGVHLGADPGALARSAQEKLESLRRKLAAEKQALAQMETRRAALKDILLYETPGSRVDIYARKMRNSFEPRLRGFGFKGEALAVFKDLARDLNESGGPVRRLLASVRALYSYPGQVRLLFLAALSYAAARGFDWLAANRPTVLGVISSAGSIGAQTADYLQSRLDWLSMPAQAFGLIALGLLGINLWRAFGFMRPLLHAAGLLDEDCAAKRHELDQTFALQARNVELAGYEAEVLAKKAAEAERRATAAGASKHPPLFLETDDATQKRDYAFGFLESLSDLLTRGAFPDTPHRLVVTVDGFENVSAPAALFARLNELLARPGFIAVFALDPLLFNATSNDFHRRIQLPLRLDVEGPSEPMPLAPLDAPLSPLETRLTTAMAPLLGSSPRAQKRLRNLFRFLKPTSDKTSGLTAALALFIAADIGAAPADRTALERALTDLGEFAPRGSSALQESLACATAIGAPIGREEARRAAALVRHVAIERSA
jgi:hypothetical protein